VYNSKSLANLTNLDKANMYALPKLNSNIFQKSKNIFTSTLRPKLKVVQQIKNN